MTAADVIYQAAKAAVTLGQPTDAAAFDARVPDTPPNRYIVVYPDDRLRAEDLAGTADTADWSWQVTCVGSTRAEVGWLRERVKAAFVGLKLVVPGWSPGAIANPGGQPIRPDTNIPGRVVLYSTDQFECIATRA